MKNRFLRNANFLTFIALSVVSINPHANAQALGGMGSAGADLPFFLNNGATSAGDLTATALSVDGIGAMGGDLPFFVNGGAVKLGDWSATALNVAGGFNATGDAAITGSMTALYYSHTSDIRLKTEIHPVRHALEKLLSIRGVEFEWKKDGRGDMGVIAQNVEKVFPNLVQTHPDGFKSVEYDALIAPVIEALRELKTDNDKLRLKVEAVQALLAHANGDNK